MVAAWLKIATLVLKASPASKKQRPHRQNVFSQHQNASTVPTRPPGLRNFARGSYIVDPEKHVNYIYYQ
jgi:hypothetical protein